MMTPAQLKDYAFTKAFKGYNADEVDRFLDEVIENYSTLYSENALLAKKIDVLVEQVEKYREEEDTLLGDFIPDEAASEPSEAASFTLLKEQLVDVLGTLTPREEKVLKLRFGIEDGRTRTLEEVGKEFNVTRERIRQIEAKALRKLRHPSRSKKLKDFLN